MSAAGSGAGSTGRHVFRFFVDAVGAGGADVQLTAGDTEHVRVVRLAAGDAVEVVDADGVCWSAHIADAAAGVVRLEQEVTTGARAATARGGSIPTIELVAGVLSGSRFDGLVDGAVQAGADRITPFATTSKDAARIGARHDRLTRIAAAAAKQAKRTTVPEIGEPIDAATLRAGPAGIALDASGDELLPAAVRRVLDAAGPEHLRVLVGPADGLDPALLADLRQRGWIVARLGPSILRSELAAPVAVAAAVLAALEAEAARR